MNLEEACRACAAAIFGGRAEVELDGKKLPVQRNAAKLRFADVTVGGEQLRVMEQNPKKASAFAEKARAGAHIVWALKGRAFFCTLLMRLSSNVPINADQRELSASRIS